MKLKPWVIFHLAVIWSLFTGEDRLGRLKAYAKYIYYSLYLRFKIYNKREEIADWVAVFVYSVFMLWSIEAGLMNLSFVCLMAKYMSLTMMALLVSSYLAEKTLSS